LPRKTRNTRRPIALLLIGFLLMAGAVALFLLDLAGDPAAVPQADTIPFPEVPRTSLVDAKAAFDAGSMIFLDVRTAPEYAQSRIPGSINIPMDSLPDRLGELNPEDRFLTVCT
jgi:3-mercaptopyruvate sulfurtransferase SseA